jgi:SAM-dependent methyltransferase
MKDTNQFYAGLAPLYHLIYPDWEASLRRQAGMLVSVIKDFWAGSATVLDVSCGIGTQALGLAGCGYRVTASDLSPEEVERARQEASARGLSLALSVADMRCAYDHHNAQHTSCARHTMPSAYPVFRNSCARQDSGMFAGWMADSFNP